MLKSLKDYDPSAVGVNNGNYFGMPFEPNDAALVLVSAPWDVTSSYGSGASSAPDAIIEASTQLDFYDSMAEDQWKKGIATAPIDYSIQEESIVLREDAEKIIEALENDLMIDDSFLLKRKLDRINQASAETNDKIFMETATWLDKGKTVGLVGGDHSTPYGYIMALSKRHKDFGILQIDAHCDLRKAYEGFTCSHASIMYNVLNDIPSVSKLVQVGIRDYCDDERLLAEGDKRIVQFDDARVHSAMYEGESWSSVCRRIIDNLPHEVYVSFDIDGLTPECCPHTGTPVVGGLTFSEASYLIKGIVDSGRTIIGFDLCEVVPAHEEQWDANVGARVLYRLCGQALRCHKE